jgi:hypothetical protein
VARSFSAGVLAAIASGTVRPVLFVEAQFQTGTVYIWSGIGTVSWNGQTWNGMGDLLRVAPIDETTSGQARGVTISLSGIPSGLLADVLVEVQAQQPVSLWIGYLDSSGNVIADPELRWYGTIDLVKISEGEETSTIEVSVESKLIDLGRARERHWTNADQQMLYPGDLGFYQLDGIQQVKITWGKNVLEFSSLGSPNQ